ncbi:cupin-like domain-containing protein [Microbulbifer pacificus]|uniref:Cupin-like domain-containing protein n=1 Tax=Microbulbifer pacificus TaxID=407164 RepID=A0AAU0N3Q1_9GAMM|nr:cupin-like domain-containing protein [Microbulbifer pacificus]WOX06885.1 cupin-like domain-containing protein [Microbulbifer pacificus]
MIYPEEIPTVETLNFNESQKISEIIEGRNKPLLIKEAVAHWPIVKASREGKLSDYLAQFDCGRALVVFRAKAETGGRIFYNDSMDGFNFQRASGTLTSTLRALEAGEFADDYCYVGSTPVDHYLPGLRDQNDLGLDATGQLVSLWFGNRTRIAAHFDLPENLACVVSGRRRFTLFPPDQVANLYPGPLDFNPAGQTISMVDFYNPDFAKFPRYREALRSALVAEMEPGDVLYLPSMWWHQVEGLEDINVLINYWWRSTPTWSGLPQDALIHALLSIGGLPDEQRQAWGQLFQHFVVNRGQAKAHIPARCRGILADLDRNTSANVRNLLIDKLQKIT